MPQIAARITSSTTSSGAGSAGSATFSIRTSWGPWKTAALMRSALELDLHVARRVARRVERCGAFAERERQVRRAAIEEALSLPRQEEVDSLQGVETRANLLWDRKIELVAASLVADEYLERSRALSGPEEAA